MRVPDGVAAKLDAGLMSQLVAAHPGERLRVVARLAESAGSPDMPAASAFPSREDWRKHLIARQQAQVEADIGGALAAIREMGRWPGRRDPRRREGW